MSHSKNLQARKSYGNGSGIKTFIGKTDIEKLDGNNLMANDIDYVSTTFMIILYSKQFHGEFPTLKVQQR